MYFLSGEPMQFYSGVDTEAVVTDLVTENDLQRATQLVLCLRLTVVEDADQPINIPGRDFVHGRLAVIWGRKRKYPTALAQLERGTAYVTCIDGRRHWRSSHVDHRSDRQRRARFGAVPLHRIYLDKQLQMHSPDPSDSSVTERVITVMLAEEY